MMTAMSIDGARLNGVFSSISQVASPIACKRYCFTHVRRKTSSPFRGHHLGNESIGQLTIAIIKK